MVHSNFAHSVMIVGNGSLFDEGVAEMLTRRTDCVLSRSTYSDDFASLDNIGSDQLDVILVCESGSLKATRIFALVSTRPMVTGPRVVVIRLRNNVIDVYPRPTFVSGKISGKPRRITAMTCDDLVSAFSN